MDSPKNGFSQKWTFPKMDFPKNRHRMFIVLLLTKFITFNNQVDAQLNSCVPPPTKICFCIVCQKMLKNIFKVNQFYQKSVSAGL